MKINFLILLFIVLSIQVNSQIIHTPPKAIQVKIELLELLYSYPRIGIAVEEKYAKYNLWLSSHYGWNGLPVKNNSRYFDNEFIYWGIKTGIKRIYSGGSGEYFLGAQLGMDHTRAQMTDGVYYHIKEKDALLYDKADCLRDRVSFFIEHGYEFFIGKKFSIEWSNGLGVRRIQNWYKNIENPFGLKDVEPVKIRNKTHYEYVGTFWKPAFISSVKIGLKL